MSDIPEKSPDAKPVEDQSYLMDGFESAFIGCGMRFGFDIPVAIYDYAKCLAILVAGGMDEDEAAEHIQVNCLGGWVGNGTPMMMSGMGLQEFREICEPFDA